MQSPMWGVSMALPACALKGLLACALRQRAESAQSVELWRGDCTNQMRNANGWGKASTNK